MDLDGVELAKEPETVVQYLKTEYPDVKVNIRLIPWAIELVRLKHCSLTGYFESRGNNTAIWFRDKRISRLFWPKFAMSRFLTDYILNYT